MNLRSSLNRVTTIALGAIPLILASPSVQAQGDEGVLEEIIVTAQKREQNIQDVPTRGILQWEPGAAFLYAWPRQC